MTIRRTDIFLRQYRYLPPYIQKKADRQLVRLLSDLRHPGLYAKKMAGHDDIWEARIDIHHRFTFQIVGDIVILRRIGPHDILRTP